MRIVWIKAVTVQLSIFLNKASAVDLKEIGPKLRVSTMINSNIRATRKGLYASLLITPKETVKDSTVSHNPITLLLQLSMIHMDQMILSEPSIIFIRTYQDMMEWMSRILVGEIMAMVLMRTFGSSWANEADS
jgi:hypothetical protein